MNIGEKLLFFVTVASFCFSQGCAGVSSDIKQEVIKKLMDREAQRTSVNLFDATYETKESKLLNAKQIKEWMKENKIDTKEIPVKVQNVINDESTLALLVAKFIPIKNNKAEATSRAYDMGGIFLPLFPFDDLGGWWIGGGGVNCDARCERCDGCSGTGHICTCRYICCWHCNPDEGCRECQSCANNSPE